MGTPIIQIKVPHALSASLKAMGLSWWYENANDQSWCSCCERKSIPVVHVGSQRDGHNVAFCKECIDMLRGVREAGALGSSRDRPFTAEHAFPPETSNRVEEPAPASVVQAPVRRKRSEMRRAK